MNLYDIVLYGFIVIALCTMPYLFRITAPYGRHSRGGFGPRLNSTLGWVLMEAPASLVPLGLFLLGGFLAYWTLEKALEFLITWAGDSPFSSQPASIASPMLPAPTSSNGALRLRRMSYPP